MPEKLSDEIKDNFVTQVKEIATSKTHRCNPDLFYKFIALDMQLTCVQQERLNDFTNVFKYNLSSQPQLKMSGIFLEDNTRYEILAQY